MLIKAEGRPLPGRVSPSMLNTVCECAEWLNVSRNATHTVVRSILTCLIDKRVSVFSSQEDPFEMYLFQGVMVHTQL